MALHETHKYDDIIDMPHHVSRRHPQMSRRQRAAQFMPFAALTGYERVIEQAACDAEAAVARRRRRRHRFRRLKRGFTQS